MLESTSSILVQEGKIPADGTILASSLAQGTVLQIQDHGVQLPAGWVRVYFQDGKLVYSVSAGPKGTQLIKGTPPGTETPYCVLEARHINTRAPLELKAGSLLRLITDTQVDRDFVRFGLLPESVLRSLTCVAPSSKGARQFRVTDFRQAIGAGRISVYVNAQKQRVDGEANLLVQMSAAKKKPDSSDLKAEPLTN